MSSLFKIIQTRIVAFFRPLALLIEYVDINSEFHRICISKNKFEEITRHFFIISTLYFFFRVITTIVSYTFDVLLGDLKYLTFLWEVLSIVYLVVLLIKNMLDLYLVYKNIRFLVSNFNKFALFYYIFFTISQICRQFVLLLVLDTLVINNILGSVYYLENKPKNIIYRYNIFKFLVFYANKKINGRMLFFLITNPQQGLDFIIEKDRD